MTVNELIKHLEAQRSLGFGETTTRMSLGSKTAEGKKVKVQGPVFGVTATEGSKEPFKLPVVELHGFPDKD